MSFSRHHRSSTSTTTTLSLPPAPRLRSCDTVESGAFKKNSGHNKRGSGSKDSLAPRAAAATAEWKTASEPTAAVVVRRRALKRRQTSSSPVKSGGDNAAAAASSSSPQSQQQTEGPQCPQQSQKVSIDIPVMKNGAGGDREDNLSIREYLLSQLEVIKRQNEDLLEKERRLRALQQENERLKQRLRQSVTSPTTKLQDVEISKATKSVTALETPSDLASAVKKVVDKGIGPDGEDGLVQLDEASLKKRHRRRRGQDPSVPSDPKQELLPIEWLESTSGYVTSVGESFVSDERADIAKMLRQCSETPGWRVVTTSISYCMEGTENIEDATFERRHSKQEAAERRRKRWDIQRIREQRNIARLRARYDRTLSKVSGGGCSSTASWLQSPAVHRNNAELKSLLPEPSLASHISLADTVLVSAFGYALPNLPSKNLELTW